MRAILLAAALLLLGLAGAPLLAPAAAAQASIAADPEPVAEAAVEVQAGGDAYASDTQARASAQQAVWAGYAASVTGSPSTIPAPTDESAATLEAAGEQGAATVAFGSRSASTLAWGAAGTSSNTMDASAAPAPTLPAGDDGNKTPEPDPGSGGGDETPPPTDAGDGDSAATSEAEEPAAPEPAAEELQAATATAPPTDEPSLAHRDLDPAQPAPSVPDDGASGRALRDGALPSAVQPASVAGPADALVSAVFAVSVLGLAAVATGAVWLACRKPLA